MVMPIDTMAGVDVNLFNSYIGGASPVSTCSYASEHCHSSLCSWHDSANRDFIFGAEMWFLGTIIIFFDIARRHC